MGCGASRVKVGYRVHTEGVDAVFNASRPRWLAEDYLEKEDCKAAFFEEQTYITRGSSCDVVLSRHTRLRRYYCLHFFHKRRIYEKRMMPVLQRRLDKAAFLGHLYTWSTPVLGVLEDPQHIILASEFHPGGDLHMLVERNNEDDARDGDPSVVPGVPRGLPEPVARFYAAEVAAALHLLHTQKRAVYCDLKPKNVAIAWDGHIKLVDSGSMRRSMGLERDEKAGRVLQPIDLKGGVETTTDYAAPEILLRAPRFDEAVDWWAFGATLCYLLTGDPPFQSTKHGSVVGVATRAVHGDRIRLPPHLSPAVRDLLIGLLRFSSSRRLGFAAIREHPWFDGVDWKAAAEHRLVPPFIPHLRWAGDTIYFRGRPERPPAKPIEDFSPMATYAQASHLTLRILDADAEDNTTILPYSVASHFLRTGVRVDVGHFDISAAGTVVGDADSNIPSTLQRPVGGGGGGAAGGAAGAGALSRTLTDESSPTTQPRRDNNSSSPSPVASTKSFYDRRRPRGVTGLRSPMSLDGKSLGAALNLSSDYIPPPTGHAPRMASLSKESESAASVASTRPDQLDDSASSHYSSVSRRLRRKVTKQSKSFIGNVARSDTDHKAAGALNASNDFDAASSGAGSGSNSITRAKTMGALSSAPGADSSGAAGGLTRHPSTGSASAVADGASAVSSFNRTQSAKSFVAASRAALVGGKIAGKALQRQRSKQSAVWRSANARIVSNPHMIVPAPAGADGRSSEEKEDDVDGSGEGGGGGGSPEYAGELVLGEEYVDEELVEEDE